MRRAGRNSRLESGSDVKSSVSVKRCRYRPYVECVHSSCSVFDRATGNVRCCFFHPHKNGLFSKRKVVVSA